MAGSWSHDNCGRDGGTQQLPRGQKQLNGSSPGGSECLNVVRLSSRCRGLGWRLPDGVDWRRRCRCGFYHAQWWGLEEAWSAIPNLVALIISSCQTRSEYDAVAICSSADRSGSSFQKLRAFRLFSTNPPSHHPTPALFSCPTVSPALSSPSTVNTTCLLLTELKPL